MKPKKGGEKKAGATFLEPVHDYSDSKSGGGMLGKGSVKALAVTVSKDLNLSSSSVEVIDLDEHGYEQMQQDVDEEGEEFTFNDLDFGLDSKMGRKTVGGQLGQIIKENAGTE